MHSRWSSREEGPWGFKQIILRGGWVLGVVRKYRGPYFRVLLHFYDQVLQTSPNLLPAAPPTPPCIYDLKVLLTLAGQFNKEKELLVLPLIFWSNLRKLILQNYSIIFLKFRF